MTPEKTPINTTPEESSLNTPFPEVVPPAAVQVPNFIFSYAQTLRREETVIEDALTLDTTAYAPYGWIIPLRESAGMEVIRQDPTPIIEPDHPPHDIDVAEAPTTPVDEAGPVLTPPIQVQATRTIKKKLTDCIDTCPTDGRYTQVADALTAALRMSQQLNASEQDLTRCEPDSPWLRIYAALDQAATALGVRLTHMRKAHDDITNDCTTKDVRTLKYAIQRCTAL